MEVALVKNFRAGRVMKVSVLFQVPSTAWKVQTTDVYEFETEVWVAARVSSTSEVGLTVISTVGDSVTISDTSKDVKYFVLGKTWGWDNSEPYEFVKPSITLSLVHQHLSTPSWPNLHKCHNDSVGAQEQTKRTVCFAYQF